jgi:hypothetical protein
MPPASVASARAWGSRRRVYGRQHCFFGLLRGRKGAKVYLTPALRALAPYRHADGQRG